MDEPVIVTEDLTKRFDGKLAVDHLDLSVDPGTIYGFIGPSGSGKTTAVRLLTGILRPTSGQVRVFGSPPTTFGARQRARIGYMPQLSGLYPHLSIWENLSFVASIYGLPLRRRRRLMEVLDFVQLRDDRRKLLREASGGMQRRVALAATLLHRPNLLFLDEPTAGIDPVLRRRFWDHFRDLRDQGRTLFITTQYIGEAAYCDVVGVLAGGRLLAADSPESLRRRAFHGVFVDVAVDQALPEDALESEVADLAREAGVAEQRLEQAEELLGERPAAEASASAALDTVGRELGQLAASGLTAEVLPRLAVIEDGLDRAGGLLARFEALDAELLVSPFTGRVQRVSGDAVRLTDFYAPAVLVLLVQHMVVTFIGLSVVREEELGTTELFRVAPVSVGEILLGKTLAYLLLGGVVAAVLVGLLVVGLGVPMLGSWPLLAVGVAAALLAAIGLAFVVALAARSDSQAVQYAMLVLLASIFFSGFILSLDRFVPAVTFLASALPATHAIRLLRGIMLRGSAMPAVLVATLAGFAAVLLAVSWAMLRRRLARG